MAVQWGSLVLSRERNASAGGDGRESSSHQPDQDHTTVPRGVLPAYQGGLAGVGHVLYGAHALMSHAPGPAHSLGAMLARAISLRYAKDPVGQCLRQDHVHRRAQGADDATIH